MANNINFFAFVGVQFLPASHAYFQKVCAYYFRGAKNIHIVECPKTGDNRLQTFLCFYLDGKTGLPPNNLNNALNVLSTNDINLPLVANSLILPGENRKDAEFEMEDYLKVILDVEKSYEFQNLPDLQQQLANDMTTIKKGWHSITVIGDNLLAIPNNLFFFFLVGYILEVIPSPKKFSVSSSYNIDGHYCTSFWFNI